MPQKISDTIVKALPAPVTGNAITYDSEVAGFGVRVTKGGARAFILNYRTRSRRERRYTIGSYPDWKTRPAREEAKEWKRRIRNGEDPLAALEAEREAPTVADLCRRFEEEHLPRLRSSTQDDYRRNIKLHVLPTLRNHKVAEVNFEDMDGLHRALTKRGTAYLANRVMALCSKMFSLAIKWRMRADNPCKGIERNQEVKRHRYLSGDELARLTAALAEHDDQQAANIIRMLMLTGARRGEVLGMRWADLDLEAGRWTKPGAATKQKTEHTVPLSAPARLLLAGMRETAEIEAKKKRRDVSEHVFPGRGAPHRIGVKKNWRALCIAAGIVTTETVKDGKGKERIIVTPSARVHDLRHTYASVLASAGLSLPIIGALLGHTQPATTARYAHLFDDPLREATERVGAIVTGKPSAEVVPFKGGAA